jgi:hypothetical protein
VTAKDNYAASTFFLDFIRSYTKLTELQLNAIRKIVADSIAEIMGSIEGINSKAEHKKIKADEVLVKEDEHADFKSISMKSLLGEEEQTIAKGSTDPATKRNLLENQLRRAGGRFSKQLEAISTLDDEIKTLLFTVMGSVSNDDVVRQRLEHVIQSIRGFNEVLAKVIENYQEEMILSNIRQRCAHLLTNLYKSYSSNDEREIFHSIFGKPKINPTKAA